MEQKRTFRHVEFTERKDMSYVADVIADLLNNFQFQVAHQFATLVSNSVRIHSSIMTIYHELFSFLIVFVVLQIRFDMGRIYI